MRLAPPGTIPHKATSSVLLSWFEVGWFSFFLFPQQTWVELKALAQNSKQLLTHHINFEIGDFGTPYWNVKSFVQRF